MSGPSAPSPRPGAIVALMTGLLIDEYAWIVLRAFTGFTMAGAFMVIESWLNEKATNENRGTVFGLYMMVTYASIMAGQMIVAAGDVAVGFAVHGGRHLLLLFADPDRGVDGRHAQAARRTCRSTSRGSTPTRRSPSSPAC